MTGPTGDDVIGATNSYWPYFLMFLNLYCIIPCTFNKLPTVSAILKSGSAHGVSLNAILLETYCYLNLQLSEGIFVAVICRIFVYFSSSSFTAAFAAVSGFVPVGILSIAMATCPLIILSSRILFIKEMVRVKDSSSMSQVAWIISFTTGLSRLISVTVETGDTIAIGHNLISTIASLLVLLTVMYYKPRKSKLH